MRAITQALSEKYSSQLKALKEEFIRFADFKAIEGQFDLLSSSFTGDIETATEERQMELIDFQADNSLKRMFESKPLVEFSALRKVSKSEKYCKKDVCVVCINLHL